jgi:hypothetical protein
VGAVKKQLVERSIPGLKIVGLRNFTVSRSNPEGGSYEEVDSGHHLDIEPAGHASKRGGSKIMAQ